MSEPQPCGTEAAVEAFQAGGPIMIFDADDREGEIDFVYPAEHIIPSDVVRMRNHGGGLICVAIPNRVANALELPFLHDAIDHPAAETGPLRYDDRSSFSLPVNHRETFTGITDEDRALTIRKLGGTAANPDAEGFVDTFRVPGHVPILKAAAGGLHERQGHTELSVALADATDCAPAAVVCEMLDDVTNRATSWHDAKEYAEQEQIPLVQGADLIDVLA